VCKIGFFYSNIQKNFTFSELNSVVFKRDVFKSHKISVLRNIENDFFFQYKLHILSLTKVLFKIRKK